MAQSQESVTCVVCGNRIEDLASATVAAEVSNQNYYESDGGEVAYRHVDCHAEG